jgi:hypothetical protein
MIKVPNPFAAAKKGILFLYIASRTLSVQKLKDDSAKVCLFSKYSYTENHVINIKIYYVF